MTITNGREARIPRGDSAQPQNGARRAVHSLADDCPGAADFPSDIEYLPGPWKLPNVLLSFFFSLIFLTIAGCSSPRPQLGAISVTAVGAQGQLSSVIVNATASISVSVANDGPNLGVDWSLNCGGSPLIPAGPDPCGTLNPAHVGSNIDMIYTAPAYVPIGNTITLTATVTSDPSISSTATLTILPQPITIAFTQAYLPPTVMAARGTAQIAATVTNDPIAAGVNWSCAPAGSCGSFNPSQTASENPTIFTAPATIPAGGMVAVTATSIKDSTKSIVAKVQVMPIAVSVTASPSTVGAHGGIATLTATLDWDTASAGVKWPASLSCSFGSGTYSGAQDCGTIESGTCGVAAPPDYGYTCTATYMSPASLPAGTTSLHVPVTATSIADPSRSGSAVVTIGPPPPVSVSVTAANSALQVGGSTTLTAAVANDYTNAGVTWQCSPGSCLPATSTSPPFTTTYTAPGTAPATGRVTATSIFCTQTPTNSQCMNDRAITATASIKIDPAISVAITPPAGITAGTPSAFSATVTNDVGHGGVVWSASCALSLNCGQFAAASCRSVDAGTTSCTASFTALNNLPWNENPLVTIKATSAASMTVPPLFPGPNTLPGSGVTDPVDVPVTPVTYVAFVPYAPSVIPVGNPSAPALISLIAVAANDSTNKGVDWSVCSAAPTCGTFQVSPAFPATATTLAVPPVYSHTIHAASGQAVNYLPPTSAPADCSSAPTRCTVTITAASAAVSTAKETATIQLQNNNNGFTGPALTGVVVAGNPPSPGLSGLPVAGASVELFAAGNQCYGSAYGTGSCPSANDPLVFPDGASSITTASDGSFAIPAGYTCSPNSLLYLTATGGTPQGLASPNAQLGFLTALGPCSNLNSSVRLVLNEITTVVSAYALAPFMGTNFVQIGSSSTNYNNPGALNSNNGLANAFATVTNLVNIATGEVLPVTSAGNGTIPQTVINTLADAIDTCAATTGGAPGDGSACDLYFQASNVNPPLGAGPGIGNSPTSIPLAMVEVAQHPGVAGLDSRVSVIDNVGSPLYGLVSTPVNQTWQPPFANNLVANGAGAPNDWSIALNYTGGGLEGAGQAQPGSTSMAIDGFGNLWIANGRISSVTELSSLGAPMSPFATGSKSAESGGFKAGGLTTPQQIAIDPIGNAWVLNKNSSLTELNLNGSAVTGSPFSGAGTMAAKGLAIDPTGNVWITDSGSPGDVGEYAGYNDVVNNKRVPNGKPVSPAGGYPVAAASNPDKGSANPNGAIAVDGKGNVWVLDGGNYVAVELSGTGQLLDTDCGDEVDPITNEPFNPVVCALKVTDFGISMAIDSSGDLVVPFNSPGAQNGAQSSELLAVGSTYQNRGGALNQGGTGKTIGYGGIPVPFAPVAIDGAGHLWQVTSPNTASVNPVALTVELGASGGILNGSASADLNLGFGCPSTQCLDLESGIAGIAVDASGNVWMLSDVDSSSVTEFIGVATPVATPLSAGKPGKEP